MSQSQINIPGIKQQQLIGEMQNEFNSFSLYNLHRNSASPLNIKSVCVGSFYAIARYIIRQLSKYQLSLLNK